MVCTCRWLGIGYYHGKAAADLTYLAEEQEGKDEGPKTKKPSPNAGEGFPDIVTYLTIRGCTTTTS